MKLRYGLFGVSMSFLVACADLPQQQPSSTAAVFRFTDVTSEAGLGDFRHVTGAYGDRLFPETMGSGIAFIDYDGDDWPDVLVVGGATWPGHGNPVQGLFLYRNNGDGTFTDVSAETGLDSVQAYGFGLAVADIDLDGDQDFFLTTVYENLLFRNDEVTGAPGAGRRFTEMASRAGVDGGPQWSTSAIFFPADADPYPDLYVGNYVPWTPETDKFCSVDGKTKSYCTPLAYEGIPGRFYHNNGDGTFSDWTDRAGFGGSPGRSLGVASFDYDGDGDVDLMVTNDALRDLLYRNNGDGTFTEVGLFAGVAFDERGRARAGMGVDAGVVDGTGLSSVFVGNFSNEMLGVYRFTGDGTFEERAAASKLAHPSRPTLTFGLLLFDADLDGDLDLFAANGHVQDDIEEGGSGITYKQPPHLFLNDGNGQFVDAAADLGVDFAAPVVARGAAIADFDRDGDEDLVISLNGEGLRLLRNDSAGRNYVQLRVLAEQGLDALGAHVELHAPPQPQYRFVRTGHSYLSSSEALLTFGLDDVDSIDSVVVRWPGGDTETWTGLEANRRYDLLRGSSGSPSAPSAL